VFKGLLPGAGQAANLDPEGACACCRGLGASDPAAEEGQRLAFAADLERTIPECRGKAQYDRVACFSGGKDSICMLCKLKKELGLKVLAFTCDLDIPPAYRPGGDPIDLPPTAQRSR
jgi:hypothetical protein